MVGKEAILSKRHSLPTLTFMGEIEEVGQKQRNGLPILSFISETENDCQTQNKHFALRHEMEINALKQNKFISPIIKEYQSQQNELNKKLPEIAIKAALNISYDRDLINETPQNFREKLRKIVNNYGYINNDIITEMNKWLEQRQKVIDHLQETTHMLQLIRHTTSAIALITSAIELARGIGTLLYSVFAVDLKPKYSNLLTWVIGGVGVTGSVLALSYSKQTAEDVFRELREEKYLLRNLLITDRKGNAVDEDVEELFPHGIDVNLVEKIASDAEEGFMDDSAWKQYISFAILLPNFKKNRRLINDRKFHASVKLFVESTAAKIWLYRMKLHKLLDNTITTLENHLDKKIFAGNEVFNQAAVNLYPIFFPLFVDARNMEKLRFICSCIAGTTAMANLNQKSSDGFPELRRTSEVLLKDYKNLRRFSQEFMNEYD